MTDRFRNAPPLPADCFLCGDLSDRNGFIELDESLRLVADIAPLAPHHLLMYSSVHEASLAHLAKHKVAQFEKHLLAVSNSRIFDGKVPLFFEHGVQPGRANIVGCCDHAHVHLLPLDAKLEPRHRIEQILIEQAKSHVIKLEAPLPLQEVRALHDDEYCWIGTDLRDLRAFRLLLPERQYVRKIVGQLLGISMYESWNAYDDDAAKLTTAALRSEFGRNWANM